LRGAEKGEEEKYLGWKKNDRKEEGEIRDKHKTA